MINMKSVTLIFFTIIICSCSKEKSEKKSDLIYFNSKFLSEMGDEKYDSLESYLNRDFEVKYLNDIIYISKIMEVNTCGSYNGDVEFIEDSLILKYILTSEEICTSTSIDRVTYIVRNPKQYKFKLKLQFE